MHGYAWRSKDHFFNDNKLHARCHEVECKNAGRVFELAQQAVAWLDAAISTLHGRHLFYFLVRRSGGGLVAKIQQDTRIAFWNGVNGLSTSGQ